MLEFDDETTVKVNESAATGSETKFLRRLGSYEDSVGCFHGR